MMRSIMPYLIFVLASLVGMKFGFWAMSAIIVIAIVNYPEPDTDSASREEAMSNKFIALVIYSFVMAYVLFDNYFTMQNIRDICEETAREDEDQCSRILYELTRGSSSEYE